MKTSLKKKEFIAQVLSNKMDKTVVVSVTRRVTHPFYGKVIKKRTKFYAHDEKNACQVGDRVRIKETRPLSKMKRWRVSEILTVAGQEQG